MQVEKKQCERNLEGKRVGFWKRTMKIWKENGRATKEIVTRSERLNKSQCIWLEVKADGGT